MQMLWPGAPTVYYGDEAGLCGFTDPDNRRPYPWGKEDKELIFLHKELIRIHRSYEAIKRGSFRMLYCEHGVLSFGRFDKNDSFLVAVNNNETEKTVEFSVEEIGLKNGSMVSLLLTTQEFIRPEARFYPVVDGKVTLEMPPRSSFVLKNFSGMS